MAEKQKRALLIVNAFPPLLKSAGGVAKRYFTLCRALIDDLGYQVTILTPVDVRKSGEKDIKRWLEEDKLVHLPARGFRMTSVADGVAVALDVYSFINMGFLFNELALGRPGKGGYDVLFMDDVFQRWQLLFLARAFGIPSVVSSHTDVTHTKSYKGILVPLWWMHMLGTHLATVHATVSKVFAKQMVAKYGCPWNGLWPPILWAKEFREDLSVWKDRAAEQRQIWLDQLKKQGCTPKYIMLSVSRWSAEKRINLLWDVIPKDCALVICGDADGAFADEVEKAGAASGRPNVLPSRGILGAAKLRQAYAAADLFLSASNFETLGNTVIEAWCSGTPVAIQPEQGHLEFVEDGKNSWFVNYDKPDEARQKLAEIASKKLGPENIGTTLPACVAMGKKLRETPFAEEMDKLCIQPALEAGKKQRVSGNWLAPIELTKRAICFVLFLVLWVIFRIAFRTAFIFHTDPEFEVLGRLGGAIELADNPLIKKESPKKKENNGVDDASYESMYKNAPATKYARTFSRTLSGKNLDKKD